MSTEFDDDAGLPEIARDKDYVMTFADGVIVRLDGEVSRLIFYQDHIQLLDKENRNSSAAVIKFEVRIPYSGLKKLAEDINVLTSVVTKSFNLEKGKNDDVKKEIRELRSRALTEFFDSGENAFITKAEHIEDSFNEIEEQSKKDSNKGDVT